MDTSNLEVRKHITFIHILPSSQSLDIERPGSSQNQCFQEVKGSAYHVGASFCMSKILRLAGRAPEELIPVWTPVMG